MKRVTGYYKRWSSQDHFTMIDPEKWEIPIEISDSIIDLTNKIKDQPYDWSLRYRDEAHYSNLIEDIDDSDADEVLAIEMLEFHHGSVCPAKEMIMDLHGAIMTRPRDEKLKGKYRDHAVRVGYFLPMPHWDVPESMDELLSYIKNGNHGPYIKAAISHVWFETIHPFHDGNGRVGRALIMAMVINDMPQGRYQTFPSKYLYHNRREYYKRLNAVRTEGDMEGWIEFFLKAFLPHEETKDVTKVALVMS